MSIERQGEKWRVRWYEDGRHPSRTFMFREDAEALDASLKLPGAIAPLGRQASPTGVYPGYTYVATERPYSGWAKIGRCGLNDSSPAKRVGALQIGNPREVALRVVWPIDVEEELHRFYADLRGWGEWFALPMEMVVDMADLSDRLDPHRLLFEMWPLARIAEVPGEQFATICALERRQQQTDAYGLEPPR